MLTIVWIALRKRHRQQTIPVEAKQVGKAMLTAGRINSN
jgi:hypothetical protein